jgi:hypothetical protein
MIRVAALLLAGFYFAAPISAQAAVPHLAGLEAGPSPNFVEVRGGCGHGRHYVRGHHSRRDGHWIKGHCARYRHHR